VNKLISQIYVVQMYNVTFKEVARLLNVETVMMKAYSNSYIPKKYLNLEQALSDSADNTSPSLVVQSKVSALESSQPLEIPGEDEEDFTVEPELVEIYTETGEPPSPEQPPLKRKRLEDYAKQPNEEPLPHAASSKKTANGCNSPDNTLDIPIESLLCLPESLQLLADSQSRIANAVESMVAIQKNMLNIMKEVSESLKNAKS